MTQFFKYLGISIVIVTWITVFSTNVFATSWAKVGPNELINRSELIVEGEYNFGQSLFKKQKGMWVPSKFEVNNYYKGSGKSEIKAAIEQYDVGWAKEFQNSGGTFILFLYKDTLDFWIPVGGPNGMVQVKNGKFENLSQEEANFLTEYLSKQEATEPSLPNSNNIIVTLALISLSLIAIFLVKNRPS